MSHSQMGRLNSEKNINFLPMDLQIPRDIPTKTTDQKVPTKTTKSVIKKSFHKENQVLPTKENQQGFISGNLELIVTPQQEKNQADPYVTPYSKGLPGGIKKSRVKGKVEAKREKKR